MTRRVLIAAAALAFALQLTGQTPLDLRYGDTVVVDIAGATAAFSLNSRIVEATAADGVVRLHGIGAGRTTVVVVLGDETIAYAVSVAAPPVVVPAGFNDIIGRPTNRGGLIESRFVNEPKQILNAIDYRQEDADGRHRELRILTSHYFDVGLDQRFGVPQFVFATTAGSRSFALGDQSIYELPLTAGGATIRGVHYRDERWLIHAGYAWMGLYSATFFATNPEYVAGATRVFDIDSDSSISAGLYYFKNPEGIAASGTMAEGRYERKTRRTRVLSQIGVGHGKFGATAIAEYDDGVHHAFADVRIIPDELPGLGIASIQSQQADGSYSAIVSRRFRYVLNAAAARYDSARLSNRSSTAAGQATFSLSSRLTATAGARYSSFGSADALPDSTVRTLSAPLSLSYSQKSYDTTVEYEPTLDLLNRVRAQAYGFRGAVMLGGLRAGAYYRHDVDLPTLQGIYAQVPGLQDALLRSGIYISDVTQLMAYLRDVSFLIRLGFAGDLRFDAASARSTVGANFSWSNPNTRLDANLLRFITRVGGTTTTIESATAGLTRRLTAHDEISASVTATRSQYAVPPVAWFAIRHRFDNLDALDSLRRGSISGHVFYDENGSGLWRPDSRGIPGAVVTMDGNRTVRTDEHGVFRFDGVRGGQHRLSVSVSFPRPFVFTTSSTLIRRIDDSADFGVSFVLGKVFGHVRNDAGQPVHGVVLRLDGKALHRTAVSDESGYFAFDRLEDGPYWISVVPDSLPAGHAILEVAEDPIVVAGSQPAEYSVMVRALRTVSGRVNRRSLQGDQPVAGAEVTIRELGVSVKTNAAGFYRLLDLPPGTFSIGAAFDGLELSEQVVIPPGAANVANVNFTFSR